MNVDKKIRINPITGLPRPPLLVRWTADVARFTGLRAYGWAIAMTFVFAAADQVTEFRFGFSRFHMAPVALLSWCRGRAAGLWMAAVCLAVWAAGEHMALNRDMSLHLWNGFVRAAYFLAAAFILSSLRQALNEETSLARTDFLTGVANRRFFTELASTEIRRARRYGSPFIVSYLDIDGFKKVNDRFGHDHGDALLRLVAQTISGNIREADTVARLGGDEFSILMPETEGRHARDVMEKLQARLEEAMSEQKWPVTFSIGTVSYPTPPASVDEMIKTADQLMYTVKQKGKNSIGFAVAGSATRRRD